MRIRDSVNGVAAERASEPRIRLITPTLLGLDRYVESAFRVNEDAYVVVVAVDYDGFAHVVFPESPGESGYVRANAHYRLPTFFAGFGSRQFGAFASFRYGAVSPLQSRPSGLIFAVASSRPLQLQRLATDDGEWDVYAVERLLWGRSYTTAGYALGRALALTGQDFDTDYSGFTWNGSRPSFMFASLGSRSCDDDYRSLYESFYQPTERLSVTYVALNGIKYARLESINTCTGQVSYQLLPVGPVPPTPPVPADSTRADSTQTAASTSRASRMVRAPLVGVATEPPDSSSLERPVARGGRIGSAADGRGEGSFRRPMIDRALRFEPPERVREEGRIRTSDDGRGPEEMMRERQERRAAAEQRAEEQERRRAMQPERASAAPPRPEPPRAEPAKIERPTPTASPASGEPARTGKPVKE